LPEGTEESQFKAQVSQSSWPRFKLLSSRNETRRVTAVIGASVQLLLRRTNSWTCIMSHNEIISLLLLLLLSSLLLL